MKESENTDEAVVQVVYFEETGRAQNNKKKIVRQIKGQKSESRNESLKKFQNGSQLRGSAKQTEDQQVNKDLHAQMQTLRKELDFYKQKYGLQEETKVPTDNRT